MEKNKLMLGQNIKFYRQENLMSQEQLADRASVHRTYIGSVERGERNLSLTNIVRISRALGIPPSTLLKGIE